MIGQEQDRVGGGFSESESFLGKLTLMDIWNTALTAADVKHLLNTCERYHGNVIAWSQVQERIRGDVAVIMHFSEAYPRILTITLRGIPRS